MGYSSTKGTPFVIPNGTADSNAVPAFGHFRTAVTMDIAAPSTLTGACTVEASYDDGVTYQTLQDGGADITVGAGKALKVALPGGATHLRIHSAAAEGGDRTFPTRYTYE